MLELNSASLFYSPLISGYGWIKTVQNPPTRADPVADYLFANSVPGGYWDFRSADNVYQDSARTTAGAENSPIGSVVDKSPNGLRISQATSSKRPLLKRINGLLCAYPDLIDDTLALEAAPPQSQMTWALETPYGKMRATGQLVGAAVGLRIPGQFLSRAALVALGHIDNLMPMLSGTEYAFIGMTTVSTVFHRIDSPSGPYPITYIGANGVTYTQTANNVTTALAAQGLTPPFAMLIPNSVRTDAALTAIDCNSNQLTGAIPSLSANTALTQFICYNNQLTGAIPSLSANTALTYFACQNNQLTGSIPSLSANTALTYASFSINQLTGSIPSLSANTALTFASFSSNQLTGSIPSLSSNTALTTASFSSNQLTGSIPSLSANTALTTAYFFNNQLTDWSGGTVSNTLGDFRAQNNLLTQAAVDAILAAFVAANRTTGTRTLDLGGTGNAAPSATGVTDKNTLISRGWTVTTN